MPSTLVIPSIALGGLTTPPSTPPSNVLVLPRIAGSPTPLTSPQPNGTVNYQHWFWHADVQQWAGFNYTNAPWDRWPLGYYVTSDTLGYSSPNFLDNVQVIVVLARKRPDGSIAPNVLEQPPIDATQSDQCPEHMFLINDETTTDTTLGGWCAYMVEQPPLKTTDCPPGTIWDPATETCKALPLFVPPIYVPPPPVIGPPPITGQPDPEGDEITDNLCAQMWAQTTAIVDAIQQLQLQNGQGGGNISACCASVVIAIGGVTATLSEIFNLLSTRMPAGGGPPLDLTPIVQQLSLLVTAVASLAGGAVDLGPVTVALDSIRDAIASAPGTDVSAIVDQLKQGVAQGDVDAKIFQGLQQEGIFTGADLQVLTGEKWSNVVSWIHGILTKRLDDRSLGKVGADAAAVAAVLKTPTATGLDWAETKLKSALKIERNTLQDFIDPILKTIIKELSPTATPAVGNIHVDPDKPLADVAAVGLNAWIVTSLIGLIREGAADQLEHIVEAVIGILGFEELEEVQIGPLVRHGIARIAEQQAKAIFQQELPGNGELADWTARGFFDAARAVEIFKLNGLHFSLHAPKLEAAYSGINARQMLRLTATGLFSDADIADELTFSAMRPASQHRMLIAAPYLATEPQRNQLRAALESAFVNGLLSEADLTSNLDSAEHNTDRSNLIVQRVKWQLLTAETKKLETEYTTLFKSGLIDDTFYRSELAGLGLQPGYVDIIAGVAEAAANATLHRKELTAAARLDTATKQDQRKAARQAFKAGTSNAATLGAALLATDLTPLQVAAQVTLAELQSAGVLRWIHGLQLAPAAATLLKDRVSALTDQRKRQQITDALYVSQLQALNIPDRYINALRAAADAMISPKTAAVVVPVLTT
jgi:hypothetical protein